MNNLIFLDTETTGLEESRVCQIAYCAPVSNVKLSVEEAKFKPPKAIEIGAMATHHITNEMVEECDPFEGSLFKDLVQDYLGNRILVAHNAQFDIRALENEGVKTNWYIDTLRVARHILPNRESHSLQYLRYDLKLKPPTEVSAHDAAGDVYVLIELFKHLQKVLDQYYKKSAYKDQIVYMVELTKKPVLLEVATFGKHKGMKWTDIGRGDPSYLKWLWENEGKKDADQQNEDLLFTIGQYLK